MDPLEKETCLRFINKIVDVFEKVNIDAQKKLEAPTCQDTSLSIPKWLLSVEDELKSGRVIKLCTIINKIRQDLKNSLKSLSPYLDIFCGAIYIEHVLNEEILHLPRNLRYDCSDRRKKVIRERKGAAKNMFLHSSILIDALKDLSKPETDCSSKDESMLKEIHQRKDPKLTEKESKIHSQNMKIDKKDHPRQKKIANRKKKKSITERISLESDKECSSLPNPIYRTLRSGVKIVEVGEKVKRKVSSKQSNNISQRPQNSKTPTKIQLESANVSQEIHPQTPKPDCCTSAKKKGTVIGSGIDDNLIKNNQRNLNQTAASLDKLICKDKTDDCKSRLEKKDNSLSLNVNCKIKQKTLQSGNDSTKEEHFKKPHMTKSTLDNSHEIKRHLPLRGKRALEAKESENSSKNIENGKLKNKRVRFELPSPAKKLKRSDDKKEEKTLSDSLVNKEPKREERKNATENSVNSTLGIDKGKQVYDLTGKEGGGKSSLAEFVQSFCKEISPNGGRSNNIGENKIKLFEEIENEEEQKYYSNFLKFNANIRCLDVKSPASFEQESSKGITLLRNPEKLNTMKYIKCMNRPNERIPADSKYENLTLSPKVIKVAEEKYNLTNIFIECSHKDKHWKTTTLASEDKYESLKHIPQVLEASCFLHACQKVLHLPFFTHYEFEWAILIPQASHLMAAIMTALLNASPSTRKETKCAALPYLEWNRKLTARISHWFFIKNRIKSFAKVSNLIGIEPTFWEFIGESRNPLSLRPFHQLTICQRVIIVKALCDHLLHVSKRIQTAIISTPNNGREGLFLGRDSRGNEFIFFPILLRYGKGDIRIYQMEEDYSVNGENKQSQETISENGKVSLSHLHTVECICKDRRFHLVADDIHSLDNLAERICSYQSEEEFTKSEKRHSEANSNKAENKGEVNCVKQKIDNKEDVHVKGPEDIDESDLFPSCEHLKLALNINVLAKNLWSYEQTLKKSRAAAKAKLAAEWEEYSKDRLHAMYKAEVKAKVHPRKNHIDSAAEVSEEGQPKTPARESLSRKAKSKESPLSEATASLSRKDIVLKMEEEALMGKSRASDEEKWEPNLWADEESEDEEPSADEDMDWKGYETIQNNPSMQAVTTNKELKDETVVKENRIDQTRTVKAAKTYTRILVVKPVNDGKDKPSFSAIKDFEQLKRHVQALNIVSSSTGNPVPLPKSYVKERYFIPAEIYKNNTVQAVWHKNQDRSFGELHFDIENDLKQWCENPIGNSQGTKTYSEKVIRQSSKCDIESFWRVKTHEELSNNVKTASNKSSGKNVIKEDQDTKEPLLSLLDHKVELVSQLPIDMKQKNVRKEQNILPNTDINGDKWNRTSKPIPDEEISIFKPFPLRSLVSIHENKNEVIHVE